MLYNKEVYFRSGNLFHALRASSAIPGVFTPVITENSILADGGVLNPLPLNLVEKEKGAISVAVNVNGYVSYMPKEESLLKEHDAGGAHWEWLSRLPLLAKKDAPVMSSLPKLSVLDLLRISYEFTQDRVTELMVERHQPDILIEIPRNTCTTFEFYKAQELIEAGKKAYAKAFAVV
jgi:NTE family protein